MSETPNRLITDPVGPTLLRLAGPMVVGIFAIIFFNVVDTFWVGQISEDALAAMSFTFPISMIVTSLAMGIGIGMTASIARALGEGDKQAVRSMTTDGLLLGFFVVTAVAGLGLLTINPVFRSLGASEEVLVLIRQYMVPWYVGVGMLVFPMLGNGALRATGDTKTPSIVMVVAGVVNAGLDPLLIFGIGPFPELGLTGAALATVGSYTGAFAASIYLLVVREKMVCFKLRPLSERAANWRKIMRIGVPAAGTNLLDPIATALLTRMVAVYGASAVASFGVGTRLGSLGMVGIGAMSAAITPVVAQNLGAARCDRIRESTRFAISYAAIYGLALAMLFGLGARPLAGLFSDSPEVIRYAARYLWVVPISYCGLATAILVGSTMNALGKPLWATLLVGLRLLVFAVPFAALGSWLFDVTGLFAGIAAANLAIGAVALLMVYRQIGRVEERLGIDRESTSVPAPAE